MPSAPGEGHERQPPFQVTGWKPTRKLRVLTPGQGKRRGGQGPGHLLHAGREEFFAGFLKELLLRLGDQVPSNLGDENWGLEAGREEEASVGQGAGGRGPGCHGAPPARTWSRLPPRMVVGGAGRWRRWKVVTQPAWISGQISVLPLTVWRPRKATLLLRAPPSSSANTDRDILCRGCGWS